MKLLYLFLFFASISSFTTAQPGDDSIPINEAEYIRSFLHCTSDTKYFAKYAVEAHSPMQDFQDSIYCKLHVPLGLYNSIQNFQKEVPDKKDEFDYSKEKSIALLFNFYANGIKVSTAKKYFSIGNADDDIYTIYFNLNTSGHFIDHETIEKAYLELINYIKIPYSSIVIETAIPSKLPDSNSYKVIACGSFTLKADPNKLAAWKIEFKQK